MIICKKCILPETFPGIKFNDEGVCNQCRTQIRTPCQKLSRGVHDGFAGHNRWEYVYQGAQAPLLHSLTTGRFFI